MLQSTRPVSILFVVVVLAFCTTAHAEIPQYINYQGKITDSGGTPVPDGFYTIQFRIYDAETGGTLLWNSGSVSVTVSDGVANALIGGSPQPQLNLEFDEDYWLLVTFQGSDQAPRVRLTSSGYSYMSSGLVPGTLISGSNSNYILRGTNTAGDGITGVTTGTSSDNCGVFGRAGGGTGRTAGVYGINAGIEGFGVVGLNPGYDTVDLTSFMTPGGFFGGFNGVIGLSQDYNGNGVIGWHKHNSAAGTGVYGVTTVGTGVKGEATATSGVTYGVYGTVSSPSGYAGYFQGNSRVTGNLTVDGTLTASGLGDITAVNAGTGLDGGGTSGNVTLNIDVPLVLGSSSSDPVIDVTNNGSGHGIEGNTWSTTGRGVMGTTWATSGYTRGVQGTTFSTYGRGVHGVAESTTGANYGGYFESKSNQGTGVYGVMELTSGADRPGVHGVCQTADYYGIGVMGEGWYEGVLGKCNTSGSAGGSYYGMRGEATISGVTGTAYGVYGHASGAGTHYGVYYSGGIGGSSAMKNIVRTEEGPLELYGHLSTENWFEDFGTGEIRGGQAVVPLADDYLQLVSISTDNPIKVFITPKTRIGEWWVKDGLDHFTLFAPNAPEGAAFDYRVVAKRPGYENARLEAAPDAYADRFLYPDISEVPAAHRDEWLKADAVRNESVANPSGDR